MSKSFNSTKVVTGPETRFSYVCAFEPNKNNGDGTKYSVSLLIPKDDKVTLDKIDKAISAAYENGTDKLKTGKSVPPLSILKSPLRDGDVERPEDEAYAGHYFINANSKLKPGVVDANLNEIIDPAEFYSGCYGRASITFYAYNVNGNKGIACGLQNLQKLKDGEPLGGSRASAASDFGDFDDEFLN